MKVFSSNMYAHLLDKVSLAGYSFITYQKFCLVENSPLKYVVLRYDVDQIPTKAGVIGKVEHANKIKASYDF